MQKGLWRRLHNQEPLSYDNRNTLQCILFHLDIYLALWNLKKIYKSWWYFIKFLSKRIAILPSLSSALLLPHFESSSPSNKFFVYLIWSHIYHLLQFLPVCYFIHSYIMICHTVCDDSKLIYFLQCILMEKGFPRIFHCNNKTQILNIYTTCYQC